MNLVWSSICCRGRASCPEIALDGNRIHIRDDYGTEVTLQRDDPIFREQEEEMPGNEIIIYGKGKKPVRMSLIDFYHLLEALDELEEK